MSRYWYLRQMGDCNPLAEYVGIKITAQFQTNPREVGTRLAFEEGEWRHPRYNGTSPVSDFPLEE